MSNENAIDKVHQELDEAKAQIEELMEELRVKTDSLQSLKRFNDAQANEAQEAKLKVEKLDQELLQKEEEINVAKHMCEDLEGDLNNKESVIKHLSAENDKLQADCDETLRVWEEEKREMTLALEDANETMESQEQQLNAYRQEIESLKRWLEASSKKCLEIEKNMKASIEQGERDDVFHKLEEENLKVTMCEDLKGNSYNEESIIKDRSAANDKLPAGCDEKLEIWEDEKRELALALEEANEKVQNQELQLHVYRQEIESLKGWLESSSKKCLDIEKNMKASIEQGGNDDMYQELEEQNMKVEQQLKWKKEQYKHLEEAYGKLREQFNSTKNECDLEKHALLDEISSLQDKLDFLTTTSEDLQQQLQMCNQAHAAEEKEACCEESRYSIEKLEQENHELRTSLKELEDAQFHDQGASHTLSRLRSELKNSEMVHKECVSRQAEWSLQLEQLTEAMSSCRSELEAKTAEAEDLKMELEGSHSLACEMVLQNQELSVTLLLLKRAISEAQLKLFDGKEDMDLISKGREDNFQQLKLQLEMKDVALISDQKDINEECDEAGCLMRQGGTFAATMDMMEESTKSQLLLEENVSSMEIDSGEQLEEGYDSWERESSEWNERICEMEFELQTWKSLVEHLKTSLEESLVMRKELENSLLAQAYFSESLKQEKDSLVGEMEEKEGSMDYLQERVVLLKQQLKAKDAEASVPVRTEQVRYLEIIEEKDKILEELQKEVVSLEQKSLRRELDMERTNEVEKENPGIKGRSNIIIDELMQQMASMEDYFTSSLYSYSSQLAEKQAEINQLQVACGKITAAEILATPDIEEKKLMIVEPEDDIRDIEQKLKLQEENWRQSKQLVLDIEAEMDAKQSKIKELTDQMETNLRGSDIMLQELKMENKNLLENATRLSSEREKLLSFVLGLGDRMCECKCNTTGTQLMDMVRSIVQSFENDSEEMNLEKGEFLVKENMIVHSAAELKKSETIYDIRSPFKEINM